jgi:hypothetical protein
MPEDAQIVGEAVGHVVARGRESGLELDSGWSGLASYRDELTVSAWTGSTETKL